MTSYKLFHKPLIEVYIILYTNNLDIEIHGPDGHIRHNQSN